MQKVSLNNDVQVFCLTVKTFPLGIQAMFEALSDMAGGPEGRDFYGISYFNEQGEIVYKAAVKELHAGEGQKLGCELFTIQKGDYLSETVTDWMKKTDSIKDVFMKLMEEPQCDRLYPCVEWYKTDTEMLCMVKMKQSKN